MASEKRRMLSAGFHRPTIQPETTPARSDNFREKVESTALPPPTGRNAERRADVARRSSFVRERTLFNVERSSDDEERTLFDGERTSFIKERSFRDVHRSSDAVRRSGNVVSDAGKEVSDMENAVGKAANARKPLVLTKNGQFGRISRMGIQRQSAKRLEEEMAGNLAVRFHPSAIS